MYLPKISEYRFLLNPPVNGFLGFVSFVVDGNFYFGNIGIYKKIGGGLRLVYPVKHSKKNDKEYPLFFPVNRDIGDYMTQKVEEAYIAYTKNQAQEQPSEF